MILGLDGPVVVLEARAAALLARPLERLVADARRRGEPVEPCVLAALADCERVRRILVATAAGSANGSDPGTSEQPAEADGVQPAHDLTTSDTAVILGCSDSLVRRLARNRRFGRKIGHSWAFSPAEVATLAGDRQAVKR